MRNPRVFILVSLSLIVFCTRADEFKFPLKTGSVKFAAIGDIGTGDAPQYEVAKE